MSVRRINAAILFSLLLLLSSCSGQASEQQQVLRVQSGQNIRLLTTTDTHYLSPRLTDNGPAFSKFMAAGDGKQLAYSDEMLDALEFDIGIQRPAAVIISGDLTNNGEKPVIRTLRSTCGLLSSIPERRFMSFRAIMM